MTRLALDHPTGRVPAAGLVPEPVVKYIQKYGLYR